METKLKGFTLAEMMVTLALTAIMVTFAFLGYGNIRRLLQQFSDQGAFITELSVLNERLNALAAAPGKITAESEEAFSLKEDSLSYRFELKKDFILFSSAGRTDTFHLAPRHLEIAYEVLSIPDARLVNRIGFDVYFREQKFHLDVHKTYDAFTKLMIEKER